MHPGELPIAAPGEVRAIHAADPAGANAGLRAAECTAAAGTHATAAHVHPTATHAAAMRVLRKGRACNCQRE